MQLAMNLLVTNMHIDIILMKSYHVAILFTAVAYSQVTTMLLDANIKTES